MSMDAIVNNQDLLSEILLRLPIKPLYKFKCVSKNWLSLISSPLLSRRLKSCVRSPCALLVNTRSSLLIVPLDSSCHPNAPLKTLKFSREPQYSSIIIQSCNGLLLCGSSNLREGYKCIYYVYNPTTEQYSDTIFSFPYDFNSRTLSLAFDPLKSPDYKVVSVLIHYVGPNKFLNRIEIYSSKTRSWRVPAGNIFTSNDLLRRGVFANGYIHWYNKKGDSFYFDVDQEQVNIMPMLPIPSNRYWDLHYFGESRGSLYLSVDYNPSFTSHFDVYQMEKDYTGWFLKYRLDLNAVVDAFPEAGRNLTPHRSTLLCVVQGESEEYSFAVLRVPGNIIRYNFKDKSSKKLCNFNRDVGFYYAQNCSYQYIESIACV